MEPTAASQPRLNLGTYRSIAASKALARERIPSVH
jgi:hypothetical protein